MGRKERTKLLRTSALNLRIFNPESLRDEDGLQSALEQLEGVLALAPTRVRAEAVLTEAISQAGALSYLISVIPPQNLNTLAQTALSLFPTTSEAWSDTCTGWRILTCLMEAAMFLPAETLDEHQRTLREMHQYVTTAPSALLALASAQADLDLPLYGPSPTPASAPADIDANFSWNLKQSQRERKNMARKRTQDPCLDTDGLSGVSALSALGCALPTSKTQAEEFSGRILTSCQAILKRLLQFFRRDVLKDVIRSMYIPVADSTHELDLVDSLGDLLLEDDSLSDIDTESETLVDDHSSTTDSEYLDGASKSNSSSFYDEGFGPWRLVLSQRARGDLRESEKGDAHMYSIWVKKMRELSHGHFSDDNQKRLIDRGFITPVFEAKMTRDTRLIYQIDLEPDPSSNLMRQVIYVYSFSNHRQVDKRLWNAIGHKMLLERRLGKGFNKWDHMGCKGRVYGKRCAYRALGMGYGETVIPPGEWSLDDDEGVASMKPPSPPQSAKRPRQLTIDLDAAQAVNQSPLRLTGHSPSTAKSAPLLRSYTYI